MVRKALLCLLAGLGAEVSAQTVALNGKVADAGGKAIGGAIVSLKSKQLADTTDASGSYSLAGGITSLIGAKDFPGKGVVTFSAGILEVRLWTRQKVRASRFDVRGDLIGKMVEENLPAGTYRFRMDNQEPGAGITVIRVSVGDQTMRFLYAPSPGEDGSIRRNAAPTAARALAKSQAVEDALDVSALGFKTKSMPITSYEGKIDITLESDFTGTCTESKSVNTTAKGSGTHSVVVETNADNGIKEGTIFRPSDLGSGKKYPILVWGQGACSKNGLDAAASMAEIASHGYFIIADGTPNGTGTRTMNGNDLEEMGRPALAYITWAIAENRKPCSKYYQSLDTAKIDANGFSCGGLFAQGTAQDPRITTWGLTSSGSFSDNPTLWNSVHTPVLFIEGNQDATGANTNGLRDYNGIAPLGKPVMFFNHKNMGHGGDLFSANGGDFTKIHLAWINWWLKGDVGATGKGALVGPGCGYCTNSNWEVKSANLP
ncbi:MAG: hypothetical protein ABI036_06555 [Fibrobacteria bacterium]